MKCLCYWLLIENPTRALVSVEAAWPSPLAWRGGGLEKMGVLHNKDDKNNNNTYMPPSLHKAVPPHRRARPKQGNAGLNIKVNKSAGNCRKLQEFPQLLPCVNLFCYENKPKVKLTGPIYHHRQTGGPDTVSFSVKASPEWMNTASSTKLIWHIFAHFVLDSFGWGI